MQRRGERPSQLKIQRNEFFCRIITAIARQLLRPIADIDFRDLDLRFPCERGFIIAGNHRSFLDFTVSLIAFQRWQISPYVFIREDYFSIPVLGWILQTVGGVPVGPNSGAAAVRAGFKLLRDGHAVGLMPEGRITEQNERVAGLGPLMPGVARIASRIGAPILLVAVLNTDVAWPLGRFFPRFHVRKSRRPTIPVMAEWLTSPEGGADAEILADVASGLRSLLRQLEQNYQV